LDVIYTFDFTKFVLTGARYGTRNQDGEILMLRLLQVWFDGVRRAFDCLSKVIKVTETKPVSRSHADQLI